MTTVRRLFQIPLNSILCRPNISSSHLYTTQVPHKTQGEDRLATILQKKFPKATYINVEDISGGCGAMYDVQIEAEEFQGKRKVMQHRMVNEALAEEIKDMHGLRINTAIPKS